MPFKTIKFKKKMKMEHPKLERNLCDFNRLSLPKLIARTDVSR